LEPEDLSKNAGGMSVFGTPVPIGGHVLPPLPYPYDALEPYISRETLRLHHDRHHQAYVNGLNEAERAMAEARVTGDFSLTRYWERQLAFNGSGHILHSIYWTNMTPRGTRVPSPIVGAQINAVFGNLDTFRREFLTAADQVQGSGWAILIWNPAWRRVEVLEAEKHEDLTQWGGIPILVVDVWEHAYYVDYRNQRKQYLDAWWNLVNWPDVERRLVAAMMAQVPLT